MCTLEHVYLLHVHVKYFNSTVLIIDKQLAVVSIQQHIEYNMGIIYRS